MQVTLNIKNPEDWTMLLPLLERLGISIQENTTQTDKKQKHL